MNFDSIYDSTEIEFDKTFEMQVCGTSRNPLNRKNSHHQPRGQLDEAERKRSELEKYRMFFKKTRDKWDDNDIALIRKYLLCI